MNKKSRVKSKPSILIKKSRVKKTKYFDQKVKSQEKTQKQNKKEFQDFAQTLETQKKNLDLQNHFFTKSVIESKPKTNTTKEKEICKSNKQLHWTTQDKQYTGRLLTSKYTGRLQTSNCTG